MEADGPRRGRGGPLRSGRDKDGDSVPISLDRTPTRLYDIHTTEARLDAGRWDGACQNRRSPRPRATSETLRGCRSATPGLMVDDFLCALRASVVRKQLSAAGGRQSVVGGRANCVKQTQSGQGSGVSDLALPGNALRRLPACAGMTLLRTTLLRQTKPICGDGLNGG